MRVTHKPPKRGRGSPLRQKLIYLIRAVGLALCPVPPACPSCGSKRSAPMDRKHLITALRRCARCRLQFRVPPTSLAESRFYEDGGYQERFTTGLPTPEQFNGLLSKCFCGTPKDFGYFISVLNALQLPDRARVLDFGCSWGYGSWQLSQSGFLVQGYEVSSKCAEYAERHLGVDMVSDLDNAEHEVYDVFFSAHVLEHVPSVGQILELADRLVKPGGYFLAFTPNGARTFRDSHPSGWRSTWGLKHPNHLDEVFYRCAFQDRDYWLCSSPCDLDSLRDWAQRPEQVTAQLAGSELLAIAQRPHCAANGSS